MHTLILSQASPFFRSMFRLPQPQPSAGSSSTPEPPTIDVQEPSETWNRVLQLLYPVPDPSFTALAQVKPVLEAARKYQLDGITANMRHVLLTPRFVQQEPLRVYAIACCYQLDDVARVAARFTLRYPALGACVDELDDIPASLYHRLLDYRVRCAAAAVYVAAVDCTDGIYVKQMPWLDPACTSFVFFGGRHPCTCAAGRNMYVSRGVSSALGADRNLLPRAYWKDLMDGAADALKDRPCGTTVQDMSILAPAIATATRCELCRPKAYTDIVEFANRMAMQVDQAVDKVRKLVERWSVATSVLIAFDLGRIHT